MQESIIQPSENGCRKVKLQVVCLGVFEAVTRAEYEAEVRMVARQTHAGRLSSD